MLPTEFMYEFRRILRKNHFYFHKKINQSVSVVEAQWVFCAVEIESYLDESVIHITDKATANMLGTC
jgi:hypothetical protein